MLHALLRSAALHGDFDFREFARATEGDFGGGWSEFELRTPLAKQVFWKS